MRVDALSRMSMAGLRQTKLDADAFGGSIPDRLKGHVIIAPSYVVFDQNALEAQMLLLSARFSHKVNSSPDTIRDVEQLSNIQEDSFPINGVPTSASLIVDLLPVFFIMVIYFQYIYTTVLLGEGRSSDEPWIFKDVGLLPQRNVARLAATFPVICTVVVGSLYSDIHGFGLKFPFLKPITIRSIFGIERWDQPVDADIYDNVLKTTIADINLVIFMATFLLAFMVTKRLFRIINGFYDSIRGY